MRIVRFHETIRSRVRILLPSRYLCLNLPMEVDTMRQVTDTLTKSTLISASRSRVKDIIIAPLKIAGNTPDSGRRGREAPFGRQRGARWLRHSSLCGACHIASSFLASAPLSASKLRGFNQSIRTSFPAMVRIFTEMRRKYLRQETPASVHWSYPVGRTCARPFKGRIAWKRLRD